MPLSDEEPDATSKNASTSDLAGYFKSPAGITSAKTDELIKAGDFKEAVINKDHLLTTDSKGTLTLTDITTGRNTEIAGETEFAYQLKVIGDHFGYLQQTENQQLITFLNPLTGETSHIQMETNVITWDTLGTNITYHLYESPTIGFATYTNNLSLTDVEEINGNVSTIGQMFDRDGQSYVWAVNSKGENVIYATATRKEVTNEFPIVAQMKGVSGTLADVVGEYWIVTVKSDEATSQSAQIWDSNGNTVLDLGLTGYQFRGEASHVANNDKVFIPVSYTTSKTPDGLLLLQPAAEYVVLEGKQGYLNS